MALLTWRSASGALWASGVATSLVACSFVLDTESLRKGGAAGGAGTGGAGGATPTGTGGTAGAKLMDAAGTAPMCPSSPDHDPCTDCLAMHCCAETMRCTTDPSCNFAYVEFQRCQRAAKKAPNPGLASAACTMVYLNNGGMGASGFVGCTLTNCSTVCG